MNPLGATISSVASLREPKSAVRPRATSFALGIVLISIIGAAISSLFLFAHSVGLLVSAVIAIATGLAGLLSLVLGNAQRVNLIHDLSATAAERRAYLENNSGEHDEILKELHDYEAALFEVSAYEQARQISRYIEDKGGLPSTSRPGSDGNDKPPSSRGGDGKDKPPSSHGFPHG